MIVISGALVVVALVLLVIGLVIASLGWVYASIAVSLLSFVFLVIGILQRRKEVPGAPVPALAGLDAGSGDVGAVVRAGDRLAGHTMPDALPDALPVDDDEATVTVTTDVALPVAANGAAAAGKVLVVAGRPRYHVDGCRYLTGKEADSVDVTEARADGFTPCGVCKPDDALAAAAGALEAAPEEVVVEAPVVRKAAARKAAPVKTAAPVKKAAAPVKKAAAKATVKAAAPVKSAPVKKAAAPVKKTVAKAVPAKAPVKASAKTAAKAPAKAAAKAPAKKAPAKKAPAKRG